MFIYYTHGQYIYSLYSECQVQDAEERMTTLCDRGEGELIFQGIAYQDFQSPLGAENLMLAKWFGLTASF